MGHHVNRPAPRFTLDRLEKSQVSDPNQCLRSWRAMTMRWIWFVPS
jgi:hypothetical protein